MQIAPSTTRATAHRSEFVAAMGNTATPVTLVTTDGTGGRCGQTVSAMCSVSADPPTMLVCVNRRSPLVDAVRANGVFSVSVLTADQAHVSDVFAGRPGTGAPYDFGCAGWSVLRTGAPVLRGAAAAFDCELVSPVDAATHVVLLGTVTASSGSDVPPLVYRARTYGRHQPLGH